MAEGLDDFEMEDRYPEYDNMNTDQRETEYDTLDQQTRDLLRYDENADVSDNRSRLAYLDREIGETSFIEGEGGGVTITDRGGMTTDVPAVEFVEKDKLADLLAMP